MSSLIWIRNSPLKTRCSKIHAWHWSSKIRESLTLYQRKYTLDLLTDFVYLGSKPCSTPMDSKLQLVQAAENNRLDPKLYRKNCWEIALFDTNQTWYFLCCTIIITIHEQSIKRTYECSSQGLEVFKRNSRIGYILFCFQWF